MDFQLNFDDGRPIAYINGGEFDEEILFINGNKDHQNKKKIDMDEMAILI